MENPATWGKAERVVDQILTEAAYDPFRAGLSLARRITDALREAGFDLEEKD